jgi:hypothetical protein
MVGWYVWVCCLKLDEGCVSEAMVDGLDILLSMGCMVVQKWRHSLAAAQIQKLSNNFNMCNERGPDTVYTAKRSNDQNLKSVSEKYHSIYIYKPSFLFMFKKD